MEFSNLIMCFCKLLQIDCIKEEIDKYIKGYELIEEVRDGYRYVYLFHGDKNNQLRLVIDHNTIVISRKEENIFERCVIDKMDDITLNCLKLEQRNEGYVYSVTEKKYEYSEKYNKEVCVDLIDKRYIFTKENVFNIRPYDEKKDILDQVLRPMAYLKEREQLDETCDYFSIFSTHMNYLYVVDNKLINDNCFSNKTFIREKNQEEEEVSRIYDIVEGPDKLDRIYDLYNGTVNQKNEEDLNAIHLGLLREDALDLKRLKGITEREENLIGKSLESDINNNYLKELLINKYNADESLELNRDSILKLITSSQELPIEEETKVIKKKFKLFRKK